MAASFQSLPGMFCRWQGGAGEGVEAPGAGDGAGDGVRRRLRRAVAAAAWLSGGSSAAVGSAFGVGIERSGFACGSVGEDEAALVGVGGERDCRCPAGAVEVEDEVVGEGGGEDERSAVDGENDRWA